MITQDPLAGSQPSTLPPPLLPKPDVTVGQRVAGAMFILNAAVCGATAYLTPSADKDISPFVGAYIFDAIIGMTLIAKKKSLLNLAIIRVVLGMVFFTAMHLFKGDYLVAGAQAAMSSSLLLLLIGNAGAARIAAGSTFFGLYALISIFGLSTVATGRNPIATVIQASLGQISRAPAGEVTGLSMPYRIKAPSDKWHLRTDHVVKRDNPLADRWLSRPDIDAHVIVIAEKVPGSIVQPDPLAEVVIRNAKQASSQFAVIDRSPLRTNPEDGRLLHTQSTVKGIAVESLLGVIGYYEHGFQVIAFAPRSSFASVEPELRSIVESFQKPVGQIPTAPAGCEPGLATRVEGVAQKYVLTPAGENWFLRKDELAKKDNALADRWIYRPDKQGHFMVIAESAPGADIDPDRYANVISENIEERLKGEVISRTASTKQPKIGRILRVQSTTSKGTKIDYLYGVFARGQLGFQVVGFAPSSTFPQLEEEFRTTIENFQLPLEDK